MLKFVYFFHIRKSYGEVWKKTHKKRKFLPKDADYAPNRFLFGKIQISFNHQKTSYVRIFTVPLIFEVWLPDYGANQALSDTQGRNIYLLGDEKPHNVCMSKVVLANALPVL